MEDGIDDAIDTLHVHEANHWSRAPPDFHEATFDNIRRSQLPPQVFRKAEERQQVRQIFLELSAQTVSKLSRSAILLTWMRLSGDRHRK
jgi:hypothetical protein